MSAKECVKSIVKKKLIDPVHGPQTRDGQTPVESLAAHSGRERGAEFLNEKA